MRRIRDASITEKLTWMNILVSAVVLLVASTGFSAWDLTLLRQAMVRRLSTEAQIVGANSVSALLFNDAASAENTLAALKATPHDLFAGIYTSDGRLWAGYWRDRRFEERALPAAALDGTETHWFEDGQLVLVRPILFQGNRPGVVVIRSDLSEIVGRLRQLALIGATVLVLCFAVAVLVSFVLRRGIAEPIVRLAETARLVSRDKDYSVRAPGDDRRDEIGTLIEAFNEMLTQIHLRDLELQQARDELESRVERRTAQLQALNKELEAFSYSVSHDLRAPLRHVDAFAEMLAEDYGAQLDSTAHHYLDIIRGAVTNMGRLMDALLNMGRLGRKEAVRKLTDLQLLVGEVRQELEPECNGRRIEWHIGALPTVECDAGLMKQVFANLLSNAIKYTRLREVAVIEVGEIRTEGAAPAIFIRDNGAGFNQRYATKLFGVFQRLHRDDEYEGTGIGLATVKRIVEKHDGQVWAEAELEKGATFYFTLGIASVPAASETIEASHG